MRQQSLASAATTIRSRVWGVPHTDAEPATLDTVAGQIETMHRELYIVADDVRDLKTDVGELRTVVLGTGGVQQRVTAVEQRAWHLRAAETTGKYGVVVTLAGVVAEIIRSHNPAIGEAFHAVIKAVGL